MSSDSIVGDKIISQMNHMIFCENVLSAALMTLILSITISLDKQNLLALN